MSRAADPALLPDGRWSLLEIAFWLAPVVCWFLFPGYLVLMSQMMIIGLFALSLDLILGYAGIVSLGHAAFFGLGAYTAGLLAAHGWGEPLTGLLAAAVVSALFGYITSFLIVRGQDLTRLMVTLGIGLMMYEAANKAAFITGGVDGLSGMVMQKLLGVFEFDLNGRTAFVYSFVVLFLLFCGLRRMVNSPFGLSLRGIREGGRRMPAIGANVNQRLTVIFTVGAGVAGIAGALLAQTTQFVGLDSLGFPRSADLLIMLVLGGTGRLYGALIGTIVFLLAQDTIAAMNPTYWQFYIGLLLIVIVLFARGGILGGLERIAGLGGRHAARRARHDRQAEQERHAQASKEVQPSAQAKPGEAP
jgi:branched-chain amino acid transport system permease protein